MNTVTQDYDLKTRRRSFMATITVDYAEKNGINLDTLQKRITDKYADDKVQYAIIKHDKDLGSEHYHIGLHFSDAKTLRSVAKMLAVQPNFIQLWNNNVKNLWGYLPHLTKNAIGEKFNYLSYLDDPSHFRTNIPNFRDMVIIENKASSIKTKTPDFIIKSILHGRITERELLTEDYIEYYEENYNNVRRALNLRQKSLILNPPKCKTLFISGSSGLGKSSLARRIAQDRYTDSYCFSSGSNDPLQDYVDEKCFIIDDFRPADYDFNGLLALLDPNIRTRSHKARYINKVLATELIIITSVLTVDDVINYYHSMLPYEDMKQLRRRIQMVINLKPGSCYENYIYDLALYDELTDCYNLLGSNDESLTNLLA